jgi:CRISPR/Cas system-associated exonuclease Cas4 (RecB family)
VSRLGEVVLEVQSGGIRAAMLRHRLMKALREAHVKRQEKRFDGKEQGIHVGNLLGSEDFCSRKAYYEHVLGEAKWTSHGDKTLMTFYEGDQTEDRFRSMLKLAGIETHQPKQTKLVGKIIGTPDVAFTFSKYRVLGEIKSMRAEKFRVLDRPEERHMQQLGSYMGLYEYQHGVLAVWGKGVDDWKFFWVEWDQMKQYALPVVKRGLAVYQAVVDTEFEMDPRPPARVPDAPKAKACKKCAFRDKICFGRDRELP